MEKLKVTDLQPCPIILNDTSEEKIEATASTLSLFGYYYGALLGRRSPDGTVEIYHDLAVLTAAQRCNLGSIDVVINELSDEQVMLRFRYTKLPIPPNRLVWLRQYELKTGTDLHIPPNQRWWAERVASVINTGLIKEAQEAAEVPLQALEDSARRHVAQLTRFGKAESAPLQDQHAALKAKLQVR